MFPPAQHSAVRVSPVPPHLSTEVAGVNPPFVSCLVSLALSFSSCLTFASSSSMVSCCWLFCRFMYVSFICSDRICFAALLFSSSALPLYSFTCALSAVMTSFSVAPSSTSSSPRRFFVCTALRCARRSLAPLSEGFSEAFSGWDTGVACSTPVGVTPAACVGVLPVPIPSSFSRPEGFQPAPLLSGSTRVFTLSFPTHGACGCASGRGISTAEVSSRSFDFVGRMFAPTTPSTSGCRSL
mmetsp:Transcript_7104/g.14369  ORF Transcript_7104/g.14369 Transcript_7104/m.14369 type:complete len:240 (-) Transcript_7104:61-780(-)